MIAIGIDTGSRHLGLAVRQAEIGWKLGLVAGALQHVLEEQGARVSMVPVADHRAAMEAFVTRTYGPDAFPDPRMSGKLRGRSKVRELARVEGRVVVRWHTCEHETPLRSLADLPAQCPVCVGKVVDRAELVRKAWKAYACAAVERTWPEAYAALVGPIRARAHTERPDHQLQGVHDGCEAAWVAFAVAGGRG